MSRIAARPAVHLVAVALAVGGALALTGCAWIGPVHEASDSTTLDADFERIRIDQSDGRVEVVGSADADTVRIERSVRYRGPERELPESHRAEGDELVLGGCGRQCTVEYRVEAPLGLDVVGETSNGGVRLTGVASVDVETDNGAIELDRVSGSVRASSDNGKVLGRALGGDGVEVETDNGAIDIALETPQDVTATTSNGAIRVAVPDGSYRVDAQTANGRIESDIDADADGDRVLRLTTDNGGIRIVRG